MQIVLSDEQVEAVNQSSGAIELRDGRGKLLGYVARMPSEQEITEARHRLESGGPWHTTEQVLRHLDSLEQG